MQLAHEASRQVGHYTPLAAEQPMSCLHCMASGLHTGLPGVLLVVNVVELHSTDFVSREQCAVDICCPGLG